MSNQPAGEVLKPCPFCGGKAQRLEGDGRWCQIGCTGCSGKGGEYPNDWPRAIASWNTRPLPQGERAVALQGRALTLALTDAISARNEAFKRAQTVLSRDFGIDGEEENGGLIEAVLKAVSYDELLAALTRPSDTGWQDNPLNGKYADVLRPFVALMERELHANAGKGDRPGWLEMDPKTALLEIFYHLSKLQKATKDGNADGIREYAADVANMSLMLVDVCGVLTPAPPTQEERR